MILQTPTFRTGFESGVLADNASFPNIAAQRAKMDHRAFLLADDADSVLRWQYDWVVGFGTARTGITVEADDDLFTKAAHGFTTGQRVHLSAITGGTGVTAGTRYWVINVSTSTFKLAATRADALAGTPINVTVDGSVATIIPEDQFLFDNLPLLHVNGATVRNCNGLPVTFTGLYYVHLRLETLDTAEDDAGTLTFAGVTFPGDITFLLDRGDFLLGELETVRAVDGDSTLTLTAAGMSNKRLSVLIAGVESVDNEEEYS